MGEVNLGEGDGYGDDSEWLCDNEAKIHMSGDITLYECLETIPSTFFVKLKKGEVCGLMGGSSFVYKQGQWREGRTRTARGALYAGYAGKHFSLHRMRSEGARSFAF